MSFLIKNGKIITASETIIADILVEGEKIAMIASGLEVSEDIEIIDAAGKLVMPGGVDVHTHLNLPMFGTVSSDDHYTGHKAAAFGGTTTAIDFVPHGPGTLKENIDGWHERADHLAAVDFSFHMNIERWNQEVAAEFPKLVDEGITSAKVFTAYNNRMRLQDGGIFKVLRSAKENGFITMLHAENGDVIDILIEEAVAAGNLSSEWHALTRPSWGAVESVLRAAALAGQADAPIYIVHMNTVGGVEQVRYARERGLQVMGETCPQYLFFTVDRLSDVDGHKWICSPPLRGYEDIKGLWAGLQDGTLQTIGTDHCPFFLDGTKPIVYEGKEIAIPGKELGLNDFRDVPNGLPGIGDRMPIMWTYGVQSGNLSPNQFVELCCTNPAKIFGLYPKKGTLMPGSDADIVIWDLDRALKFGIAHSHQRTDHNLYEGWELLGYPEKVFLRGKKIVDGENWYGRAGMGNYLHRKPNGEIL